MPKLRTSLLLAAGLLAGLAAPMVSIHAAPNAVGVPGGPFATAFRVQNLGTAPTACQYEMYADNGSLAFSKPIPGTIQPGDSAYVYTPTEKDANGNPFPTGTFAGVISCDQPVAAVVNFSEQASGDRSGNKGDSFVGVSNPANTVYAPSVYNNYYGFYTTFRIQNASTTAQTVTINYFAPGATSAAKTQTIQLQPNGAATVDQAGIAELQANVAYSAKVSGSQPLAMVASIYGGANTQYANQVYSYTGFSSGATTYNLPLIMHNYYGYNTATTIQNIGSQAANVRLTYSNGTFREYTIQPNSSQVVSDFSEPTLQANVLYSSKVESTNGQPLIVTVNESTPSTSRASTYEGMSASSRTVVVPITMKRLYQYNSSVTCQNVGTAATTVSIAYKGSVSVNGTPQTIQPGKTALFYQPDEKTLPDGFIGSATLTSSAADIVCVVNQDKNEQPAKALNYDFLSAYNAINK